MRRQACKDVQRSVCLMNVCTHLSAKGDVVYRWPLKQVGGGGGAGLPATPFLPLPFAWCAPFPSSC